MKRILSLVAFFATLQASAQQVNPVPDYVFRNQMSVGRNAVTDTAAYFSIGPRYGANKGFMPPIVGDTATFSSGKRNGLLIFSVQKNKFLYWDSVRVQWSDMAGSSGAYIVAGDTATMLLPYLRKADTTAMLAAYLRKSDTLTLSNRINLKLNATDTASLSNRINLKLNIADTASMLSPYYRSAAATAALATKLNISDTATMLSPYARTATVNASLANKLNISDTSTMLTPYLRKVDTTAMLSPYYRSATATAALALKLNISDTSTMLGNYVRHAGYGLTKSGQSFLVDTLNISTRAWRQKGIDSVAALVGSGTIGGSGTTNYVPKFTGASTIGNSIIFDNGTNVGIGTASPATTLDVRGITRISTTDQSTNRIRLFNQTSGNTWDIVGGLNGANNTDFSIFDGTNTRFVINTSGNVGIGTESPFIKLESAVNGANSVVTSIRATNSAFASASPGQGVQIAFANDIGFNASAHSSAIRSITTNTTNGASDLLFFNWNGSALSQYGRINSAGEWLLNSDGSDAGDYKLQVVGNARIGTGKLDIASNTVFGLGVARSGTSEVAGQIYNSNGILYFGAESSAGGQIFTGSSAYAAVIGSGANYPMQFATNNVTRATINTDGELLVNTTTDAGDYKLQVSGKAIFSTTITTGNGVGLTAKPWLLGSVVATNVQLDTSNYVEVEINGTFYRLAIVTPL